MAGGRAPRKTAGNRLSGLLEAEEEDEFYQTTYGGFTEARFGLRKEGRSIKEQPAREKARTKKGVGECGGAPGARVNEVEDSGELEEIALGVSGRVCVSVRDGRLSEGLPDYRRKQ